MAGGLCAGRVAVLTSTKGLQSQLVDDFGSIGLRDIRGMNNYVCHEMEKELLHGHQSATCDEGPCRAGYKCELASSGCDYFNAQRTARESDALVTNYAYWMGIHAQKDDDGAPRQDLGGRDWLVCDEAQDALDELGGHLAIDIGLWEIERAFPNHHAPDNSAPMSQWKQWAAALDTHAQASISVLSSEIKSGDKSRATLTHYRELRDLQRRLHALTCAKGEWVHELSRDRRGRLGIRFDPVWPASYAEECLFLGVDKVVLTSATIRPKTLELLGVANGKFDFTEYKSGFPVDRRPFVWVPTVRVRYDMDAGLARLWAAKIGGIVRSQGQRKGVIHTVSYARAKYLLDYADFGRDTRIVFHESGGMRQAVEEFKSACPPAVLISPSVGTGFDFPGDECRYQIIGKVPFPDTRNKVMEARQKRDPDYFAYVAAQNLVQMAGRGMRSSDDWCQNFIVDDQWGWFGKKYGHFMPQWFMDACRVSNSIPAPMKGE